MVKWIYSFGDGKAEGAANMRDLLGGKGANLAEMSSLGLPVPPGFTITTEVCTWSYGNGQKFPDDLAAQASEAMRPIGTIVGRQFRAPADPLLASLRAG